MSLRLLIVGISIHLILIYSIFDVYYTSPVIKGINAHYLKNVEPPSKRVVIYSADGLRYDTFNNWPEKSPFLHDIIRNRKGVAGLSLSHVPTESRPGHVAIFAGITEDVSSVAKGWKKNPVKFDSVFNRSSHSYMWGSPDIVSLFDDIPAATSFYYSEEEEDFSSDDASNLDKWVFDNFENFLKSNSELKEQSQVIFFLHLLGIDTNGHGHKPKSNQYIDNIKVVDDGIAKTTEIIEEFFGDGKTAYIFTSDHGMTDWGSHGAGSDVEVLTPFVAWGAGIRKGGVRHAINQIDFAPLISMLIGTAIPTNSMGVLPVSLMNSGSQKYEFRAILANFLQLKEQIVHLRNGISHRFWFQQFPHFGDKSMNALESEMVRLAKIGRFEAATSLFVNKAHLLKDAIVYYHRYDQQLLGSAVTLIFFSWICLISSFLIQDKPMKLEKSLLIPNNFYRVFLLLVFSFGVYCPLSLTQFSYILLPVYLFAIFENNTNISTWLLKCFSTKIDLQKVLRDNFVKPFLGILGMLILIAVFVLVFIDRKFLVLVFLLLMFLPAAYNSAVVDYWSTSWRIICCFLLPFPFLPSVGVQTHISLCIASPAILSYFCNKISNRGCCARIQGLLKGYSKVLLAASLFIFIVNFGFNKPPTIARWISWMSIPLSFITPSITSQAYMVDRLIAYSLAFFIPYCLLSISYESLFMLIFIMLLMVFFRIENSHLSDVELMSLKIPQYKFNHVAGFRGNLVDIRRSVVCVALVLCTLFGTGNFASINSFNPSTLNLFISVFSPFTMAILLILKLLLPILSVTKLIAAIVRFEKITIQKTCSIVLIITDLMSMCFFHQLKDEGSWLDIGMSISQYIVSMCISLALLLLLSISSALMRMEFSRW
ncbi:unnamed protein product [Caenorhabditis bovis]|uniref:GPI ethanolamine phosphate transferase 1 n=1 Tax=Caenorhabditis bovis TaxID=2654633 RepID=A0A8S1F026_9PELO|nr:unnamed protein product [Caenorhabditis bovis]